MTIQQLSEEIRVKIAEAIQSKEIQALVEKTKAATDSGNFEVVISTGDVDRQGESVDQNGLDFTFYKMNPVVLWAHDYYGLPIGITDEIGVQDGKTIAKGRFAPADANPFAQQIRKLYDLKIVQTTSIGMIVKEKNSNTITKAELLEFSFVPVPANPFALSLSKAQELGLDLAMLATKGIAVESKADPVEGDPCEMPDGTAGEMKPDGNGAMVCMPKPETKPETTENYIRIPVKDAANYDADSIRTIDISPDEGIKALTACPTGEFAEGKCNVGVEVITYLFDAEKWTEATAQAWVDEHEKAAEDQAIKEITKSAQFKSAIDSLKQSLATFEQLLEGDDGKVLPDGEAQKQRSQDEGSATIRKLDEFLMTRQILKSIATQASEALERMNKKLRSTRHA